jgi:hypothetical protein
MGQNLTVFTDVSPLTLPPVNSTTNGVMTSEMLAQLNSIATFGNTTIYVDSVTGNDSNNGTTPGTALQTLDKAISLVPPSWNGIMVIDMAAGTYSLDTNSQPMTLGQPVGPNATSIQFLGKFSNELGTLTNTLLTNGTSVTAAITPIVDAYRGAFISITSGANVGQRRMIVSNTALGQFNVNSPFLSQVQASDTFIIEKPTVRVDKNAGSGGPWFNRGRTAWKGINFFINTAAMSIADGGQMQLEGCTFDLQGNSFQMGHRGAEIQAESFPFPWGPEGPNNPFSVLRAPAGCYMFNGDINLTHGANFQGYWILDSLFLLAVQTEVDLFQLFSRNTAFDIDQNSQLRIDGGAFNGVFAPTPGQVLALLEGGDGGGDSAILIEDQSSASIDRTIINGADGDAITTNLGGFCELNRVSGTGNGGFGLNANSQSHIHYETGGSGTTVTGTSGDVNVGANTWRYDQIAGVDDTAAAGSTTTIVNLTTGGLTPSDFVGLRFQIGVEVRTIIANGASTVTVDIPFSTAPGAATPVSILVGYYDNFGNLVASSDAP